MADWTDIQFLPGQLDYIDRLNTLRLRSQAVAAETTAARDGSVSLLEALRRRTQPAEVTALIDGRAVLLSGLRAALPAAGWRITGLGDPIDPQDAATRAWALARITAGGDPSGIPVTSLNVGTTADAQVLSRSGTTLVGRTIAAGSARVTVTVTAGAYTIDVPATTANTASANTWSGVQSFALPPLLLAGDGEGGEIMFQQPSTGTAFNSNVHLDVFGNIVRVFAVWGAERGARLAILDFAGMVQGQQTIWHSTNHAHAHIIGGTATGRVATWNHVAGRWEQGADAEDSRGNLRDVPVVVQDGAYTFSAADRGRKIIKTGATAPVWTIAPGLPVGMTVVLRSANATGSITVARGAGVVLRRAGVATHANATLAPWGEALLHCEGVNTWVVSGTGLS